MGAARRGGVVRAAEGKEREQRTRHGRRRRGPVDSASAAERGGRRAQEESFFFCHRETGRGEGRAIFLTADCGLVSKNNEGLIGKFRDKEKRRYFYRGLQVDFQKIRGPK